MIGMLDCSVAPDSISATVPSRRSSILPQIARIETAGPQTMCYDAMALLSHISCQLV